jgi:hypothetical protein
MFVNILAKLLDNTLFPYGFKRKGNNWVHTGAQLTKMVNLQKSNYGGECFYINYGYIINKLQLTKTMHVFKRLGSSQKEVMARITNLLDLESPIIDEQRITELSELIRGQIVDQFNTMQTEDDILSDLKRREHLNNIPLVVKEYFNLL